MAYFRLSSLLGQLKINDPKDIEKDMSLHTYVIELPGVKAESVQVRVSEGRFLLIDSQGCKETVSPLEAELERIRKKHQEDKEKRERESQERIEEMRRESQEWTEKMKRESQEWIEKMKRESQERIEKMERESKERIKQIRGSSRTSRNRGTGTTSRRSAERVLELSEAQAPPQE